MDKKLVPLVSYYLGPLAAVSLRGIRESGIISKAIHPAYHQREHFTRAAALPPRLSSERARPDTDFAG